MADQKISELTAATELNDDDLFVISQAGDSKSIPALFLKGTRHADYYGLVGDDATDNTAALQAALEDLNADFPDGAALILPSGIYQSGPFEFYRRQFIVSGDGPGAATLKLKANSNADFWKSENFGSLTTSGAVFGTDPTVPSFFGMMDMRVDGNASNQGAGLWRGVAWYGNAQMMLGFCIIENCKGDNIYTESAGGYAYSATDWLSQEEGYFEHVISRNAGRYGWLFRGPHDSVIIDYIGNENASTNFRSETSGTTYVGSCHIHNIHTYTAGDGTGQYYGGFATINECHTDFDNLTIASGGIQINKLFQEQIGQNGLNGLEITSAASYITIGQHVMTFQPSVTNIIGCNIQTGGGGNIIIDNINATQIPGTSGITLYKIRANFVSLSGVFSNAQGAGSIGIDLAANNCNITGSGVGCDTLINYGGGSENYVQLADYSSSGATDTLVGSPGSLDTFLITSDTGWIVSFPGLYVAQSFGGNTTTYNITNSQTGFYVAGYKTQNTTKGAQAFDYDGYNAPSTGFSLTFDPNQTYLTLNPAGTLAAGTITMDAIPMPGQLAFISSSQIITSLTVAANTGHTIKNPATTLAAGGAAGWKFRSQDNCWYRIQ